MNKKLAVILPGILASVFSMVTISEAQGDSMKIRLKVGDTVLTATLIDSATTRDFISLLPLTLTLKDYAGTEKSVICQKDYLQRARLRVVIPLLEILPIMPPGEIWRYFIEILGTQADLLSSER